MDAYKPLINLPSREPPTPIQLQALAAYCQKAIVAYAAGSEQLGAMLDPPAINRVLDALEQTVKGQIWEQPTTADIREFYLHGLYFELNELRASLKEQTNDKVAYPISDAVWLAVIAELRRQLKA